MRDWPVWIDAGMRLAIGLALLAVPKLAIVTLGLPKTSQTFWPRMAGVLLLALAAGTAIDARWPGKGGPTIGGLVALNVAIAFALATALVVGQLEVPGRGRLALWIAALGSALLALLQLAWV